jgi:hypothetical protein
LIYDEGAQLCLRVRFGREKFFKKIVAHR